MFQCSTLIGLNLSLVTSACIRSKLWKFINFMLKINSLQMGSTVQLKWTPNSLMDAGNNSLSTGPRKLSPGNGISWQQAISINMATILYIHCHQVSTNGWLHFIFILHSPLYFTRCFIKHTNIIDQRTLPSQVKMERMMLRKRMILRMMILILVLVILSVLELMVFNILISAFLQETTSWLFLVISSYIIHYFTKLSWQVV